MKERDEGKDNRKKAKKREKREENMGANKVTII
jgi:hypothetical protein